MGDYALTVIVKYGPIGRTKEEFAASYGTKEQMEKQALSGWVGERSNLLARRLVENHPQEQIAEYIRGMVGMLYLADNGDLAGEKWGLFRRILTFTDPNRNFSDLGRIEEEVLEACQMFEDTYKPQAHPEQLERLRTIRSLYGVRSEVDE